MNIVKFIRKSKFFTLIELIVVIVVLGILAAIVIPNISSFKEEAEETAILSNQKNIQVATDLFMLKNNGVTPTKEIPTIGNPQIIEIYGLKPEQLRDTPKNKNVKFWLDHNYTVWASMVDAPTKVDYNQGILTWDSVDGVELYRIYKSEDAVTASTKNMIGIKFLAEVNNGAGLTEEKTLPKLSKGTYLVSAVDKFGFESAPTKVQSDYLGYGSGPDKDYTFYSSRDNLNQNINNSCKDILLKNSNSISGIYTLTSKEGLEYQVYCNMDTDSGGWTFVNEEGLSNTNVDDLYSEVKGGYHQFVYDLKGLTYNEVLVQRVGNYWCNSWSGYSTSWGENSNSSMGIAVDKDYFHYYNGEYSPYKWVKESYSYRGDASKKSWMLPNKELSQIQVINLDSTGEKVKLIADTVDNSWLEIENYDAFIQSAGGCEYPIGQTYKQRVFVR